MAQVKGRLAVLTGGGDCPGLNAVIRAVVKTALKNGYEIYGIENGFNGLITGTMKLMDYASVSGILPRGGTILGTTNRDNPFHFAVEENGKYVFYDKREEVDKNLRDRNIEALVVWRGRQPQYRSQTCCRNAMLKWWECPRRLTMICSVRSAHSALTRQWQWRQKHWTGCTQRQNHITA